MAEPASQRARPTQDEIRSETREFGREMDQFERTILRLGDRLDILIAAVMTLTATNGKPNATAAHHDPQVWPYAGIDTARDHREWGRILSDLDAMNARLGRLERAVESVTAMRQSR